MVCRRADFSHAGYTMQLIIAAVGHKMPAWISDGFNEYAKRMPSELRIQLKEIKPADRTANGNTASAMSIERDRIETVIPRDARRIALDERGRDLTTMELSTCLLKWQQDGRDVTFIIGGADGLDPQIKSKATMLLRISSLTLPHGMVRVILAEQLYRAWSITQNHPYHRV